MTTRRGSPRPPRAALLLRLLALALLRLAPTSAGDGRPLLLLPQLLADAFGPASGAAPPRIRITTPPFAPADRAFTFIVGGGRPALAAAVACATFRVDRLQHTRACTSAPLRGGQVIAMQAADPVAGPIWEPGSSVFATVTLAVHGGVQALAVQHFTVGPAGNNSAAANTSVPTTTVSVAQAVDRNTVPDGYPTPQAFVHADAPPPPLPPPPPPPPSSSSSSSSSAATTTTATTTTGPTDLPSALGSSPPGQPIKILPSDVANVEVAVGALQHRAAQALVEFDGDSAKFHVSEAETMAITALTEAGTNAAALDDPLEEHLAARLTSVFVGVTGQRSKFWEILGHYDLMVKSYAIAPDEARVAASLVGIAGHRVVLPGFIPINNATALPRLTYAGDQGQDDLDSQELAKAAATAAEANNIPTENLRMLGHIPKGDPVEEGVRITPARALRRFQTELTRLLTGQAQHGVLSDGTFNWPHFSEIHRGMFSSGFYLSYLSISRSVLPYRRLHSQLLKKMCWKARLPPMPTRTPQQRQSRRRSQKKELARRRRVFGPAFADKFARRSPTHRLRVGFVGRFLLQENHSVRRLLGNVVCALAQNSADLDVVLVHLDNKVPSSGSSGVEFPPGPFHSSTCGGRLRVHPVASLEEEVNLRSARDTVANLDLDVVVFPSFGMEFLSSMLAQMRFAPAQMVWWGHPQTTGSKEVDLFATSDSAEVKKTTAVRKPQPKRKRRKRKRKKRRRRGQQKRKKKNQNKNKIKSRDDKKKWRWYKEKRARTMAARWWPSPGEVNIRDHYTEPHVTRMLRFGGAQMDDPAVELGLLPAPRWSRTGFPSCTTENDYGILTPLLASLGLTAGPVKTTCVGTRVNASEEDPRAQRDDDGVEDAAVHLHLKSKAALLHELDILDIGSEPQDEEVRAMALKAAARDVGSTMEKTRIYFCGQPSFKLHPLFFDRAVAEILRRDPGAHVVLLQDRLRDITTALADRISAHIHETLGPLMSKRVHMVPRRARVDFLRLFAAADVVLDSFPFGGGVTTLEALSVGAPVVTLPDPRYLRGRFSQAYIKELGDPQLAEELIVRPKDVDSGGSAATASDGGTEGTRGRRLPPNWFKAIDHATRKVYYYQRDGNGLVHKTQWEWPSGEDTEQRAVEEEAETQTGKEDNEGDDDENDNHVAAAAAAADDDDEQQQPQPKEDEQEEEEDDDAVAAEMLDDDGSAVLIEAFAERAVHVATERGGESHERRRNIARRKGKHLFNRRDRMKQALEEWRALFDQAEDIIAEKEDKGYRAVRKKEKRKLWSEP